MIRSRTQRIGFGENRDPSWWWLLVLVLLAIPIGLLTVVGGDSRTEGGTAPPQGGGELADRPQLESIVLGDELWSASGGVWHLSDGLWVRNGTVPDRSIAFSPDGTSWVETTSQELAQQLAEIGRPAEIRKVLIPADGTMWACSEGWLFHLDDGRWESFAMPTELGVFGCELAVTSDGSVWVGTFNAWRPWVGGLARFDGTSWDLAQPLGEGTDLPVVAMSTGPDDELWTVFVDFEEATGSETVDAVFRDWMMASYDGTEWTTYSIADDVPDRFPVSAVTTFDGAVWYEPGSTGSPASDGLVTFDGKRWVRYLDGQPVDDLPAAASGTVWLAGPAQVLQFPPGG